jgi:PAS domain-containing protein
MPPEDVATCAEAWLQAIETGFQVEAEVRLISPDTGQELWNQVRLVPFQRDGARRAGWIGACIDLSERKQRETALRLTEN